MSKDKSRRDFDARELEDFLYELDVDLGRRKRSSTRFYFFKDWPRQLASSSTDDKENQPLDEFKTQPKTFIPRGAFMHGPGKIAGNGIPLWGHSLLDFYYVSRTREPIQGKIPVNIVTPTTGSRIAAWVRENVKEEAEVCQKELDWADEEPDPELLHPVDVKERILEWEEVNRKKTTVQGASETEKTLTGLPKVVSYGLYERPNPFHSSNIETRTNQAYRREPFLSHTKVPQLQYRIPHHLLPQRLLIHDPLETLTLRPKPFCSADDQRIVPYKIVFTSEMQAAVESVRTRIKDVYSRYLDSDSDAIIVPPLLQIPEAHMYISNDFRVGSGNHSKVYSVELELPRVMFWKPTLCGVCVADASETHANDGTAKVQTPKQDGKEKGDDDNTDPSIDGEATSHAVPKRPTFWHPEAGFPCPIHNLPPPPPRTTATVRLLAKVTRPGDTHLANEARNYQRFPMHFFEHWSGYNLVTPLGDTPVPIGALVPQFYGYYVSENEEDAKNGYQPFILMEDCGKPVSVSEMSIDEKIICASMFCRMHYANWEHSSIAERNVVAQSIPPYLSREPKSYRSISELHQHPEARSFRIVDFGRSVKKGSKERGGDGDVELKWKENEQGFILKEFKFDKSEEKVKHRLTECYHTPGS